MPEKIIFSEIKVQSYAFYFWQLFWNTLQCGMYEVTKSYWAGFGLVDEKNLENVNHLLREALKKGFFLKNIS